MTCVYNSDIPAADWTTSNGSVSASVTDLTDWQRDGLQSKSSGNLADEIQSLLTHMSSEGAQSWLGQHQWSNNNCESANHLLKMQVQ